MKYALFTGLLAVVGVNGKATYHISSEHETVERLRAVPEGWSEVGAPSHNSKLHFRIALRSVCFH